ncbi:hypothetical protein JAAARDRAFT_165207 [Jaapia argillacea MUCL 33604]|uniref:Peptidase C14 caspase domain-containing protein n=1 Tax=Jaapia argillacea MUCL 33604 TaxID=933084 RepID=A0A067P5C5_9AGAM|nr:hypothetical protein JAAARDRAFT_165207 [Jaapia argillacea MUCL 33604]
MSTAPKSFFALLVGIDEYGDEDTGNLLGAVNDTQFINHFLTANLKVPEDNILILNDSAATKKGIVSAIQSHLINNPSIRPGDPILFYFAGHGSEYNEDPVILDQYEGQTMCVYDRAKVGDLLDYEVGQLLSALAVAKGDNTTVILDCCHSGSGTRSAGAPAPIDDEFELGATRFAKPLKGTQPFPKAALGEDLIPSGTRHAHIKSGFQYPGLHTHVLLAACRPDQTSREAKYQGQFCGYFTATLLKALSGIELPHTSYMALIAKINAITAARKGVVQIAQCEGKNKGKVLFDGKALGVDRSLVPCSVEGPGVVKIEAGEIHGVRKGTRFRVYPENTWADSVCLGHAEAESVDAGWCLVKLVEPNLDIKKARFAAVDSWNNPPFTIAIVGPPDTERQKALEAKLDSVSGKPYEAEVAVVRTESQKSDEASLVVSISEDKFKFERGDTKITKFCPTIVDAPSDEPSLQSDWNAIQLAARFDMLLHHENPLHPYKDQITLELHRVDTQTAANHLKNGRADLRADDDPETGYSLWLHNSSMTEDVWCSAYYFDPGNYSIAEIYEPPERFSVGSIRKHSTLKIGGNGEGADRGPLEFFLAEDEEHDTGFLKVYLSTDYANLAMLEQGEFKSRADGGGKRGAGGGGGEKKWDIVTVVIHVYKDQPLSADDS